MLQHTFPQDYRSGPSVYAWDPTKWAILALHAFGLVTNLRRARPEDVKQAELYMHAKHHHHHHHEEPVSDIAELNATPKADLPLMTVAEVRAYLEKDSERRVVLIDRNVVDATAYVEEHVRTRRQVLLTYIDYFFISPEALPCCASIRSSPRSPKTPRVSVLGRSMPGSSTRRRHAPSGAE